LPPVAWHWQEFFADLTPELPVCRPDPRFRRFADL